MSSPPLVCKLFSTEEELDGDSLDSLDLLD